MSDAVDKKTVDDIIDEINQLDINDIALDSKTDEFLDTVEAYLHCFNELGRLYEQVDPDHKLANYDMANIKLPIQQGSESGEPVKNIAELYEVAETMYPVFVRKAEGLVEEVTSSSPKEESSHIKFKLPPGDIKLKGKERALEKAKDDYSEKVPGPPESWIYDIVVEAFCLRIQITNNEDNSNLKHICELQLHITAIKEAATELKSHHYYEFFRKYYAGATDSLKERMDDFRVVCKGGSLDMAFLANVIQNPLELDQMKRLADLFANYMNQYQLAIMVTNAMRGGMEPQLWYMRMGWLLWRLAQLEEAMVLYETALEIQLKALGPDSTHVAGSYHNMANILDEQDKFEEAMVLYEKVLSIRLNALGPDHTSVAASYISMGCVLDNQGNLEEDMVCYEKVLSIYLKAHGPDHAKVADCYYSLASLLKKQDKLEEAMVLYEKLVNIRLDVLGPYHTDVADCYHSMAIVLIHQGELEEATVLQEKVVNIRLKVLGPDHSDVADSYHNMAVGLLRQGKLEEAVVLYEKVLTIRLKALGPIHSDVADCCYTMASLLEKQDKLEEAMVLYEKVLNSRLNALGPGHTLVADSYNNMALVLEKQGNLEEAMVLYEKALNIRLEALGPDHTDIADSYKSIAIVLLQQREPTEAKQYAENALNVFIHAHGSDHPETIQAMEFVDWVVDLQRLNEEQSS